MGVGDWEGAQGKFLEYLIGLWQKWLSSTLKIWTFDCIYYTSKKLKKANNPWVWKILEDLFLTNSFPLVAPQTLQQLYFQCFILASRCVIVFHFGFCLHFPQNMRSSIFSYVYSPFGYHPFEVFFWFLPIFPLGHLFSFICRSYILWIQVLCHIFVW